MTILKPKFATFWKGGPLSPYELACLHSFTSRGYEVAVYSYEPIEQLPDWLISKDAHDIVDPKFLTAYVIDGKPSMAHFTDHFRFEMFTKTDEIWIDTDIVLLRDFDLDWTGNMMGYEGPGKICTAIMHLDKQDPRTRTVIDRVEQIAGTKFKWGATGPKLLTDIYGPKREALPEHVFYPVHHDDFADIFVPALHDDCVRRCKEATTIHLWNHLIAEMGVHKKIGPPKGSYLYEVFRQSGGLEFFTDFYSDSLMKHLVHNMTVRPGPDAGIITILRLIPGALRATLGRYLPVG